MPHPISLRDYLRQRAAWVWNEQGHAFDHGLTLQEETLTEMLLLRMARDHAKHGLAVTMFNKTEEGINGADWEWIIRTRSCELGLRVQAKRLFHHGKSQDYGGLDPKSDQADKLITKAGPNIPLYVFFNHDHGLNSNLLHGGGEHPYRGRSYWGCAIACAKAVKMADSNKLNYLKKIMKPWHRLVTISGKCDAKSALGISPEGMEASMPQERREIIGRITDRDFMSQYIQIRDLAGVAILDFSDFRGR
ncbi:MAG: hypothetical protein KDE08_10775 [Rhodobacteraceae bacterium]|nr:hypothetical protein [Paracoccaceae bacterium]